MEVAMQIYPVPVEVTQARIQLLAEQTAKAPPAVINKAVLDVFAAKNQAEREAIVDLKV
jgi:predicted transcriptional regulator